MRHNRQIELTAAALPKATPEDGAQQARYKVKQARPGRWRVSGYRPNGVRLREAGFVREEDARARVAELEDEDAKQEKKRRPLQTWLSVNELRDAELAYLVLQELGVEGRCPLTKSVRLAKGLTRSSGAEEVEPQDLTILDVLPRFLKEKREDRRTDRTIGNLRSRVGILGRYLDGVPVRQIRSVHLSNCLRGRRVARVTKANDVRAWSSFFGWIVRRYPRLVKKNLTKGVEMPPMLNDEEAPKILSAMEVAALLSAAARYKKGKLVPYVVLCVFCGLRPSEAARVRAEHVHLDERELVLNFTKVRSRRVVEIPPVAVKWLRRYLVEGMSICGKNWRKDFLAVRKLAGFGKVAEESAGLLPWVADVMRHTAISHRLTSTRDEQATALWAGTSPAVIHRRYKGLIYGKEVGALWRLTPRVVLVKAG